MQTFNLFYLALLVFGGQAIAAGMQPETSIVIILEDQGQATISVRNTDARAGLLYTSLENLPGNADTLVIVNPPIARVDAGESQLVRFILKNKTPLTTQLLKRVIFEGIPAKKNDGSNEQIAITTRQNLPLLIHPKGLELDREPWKKLTWTMHANELILRNDSPYVVRTSQSVQLLPGNHSVNLPKSYILPGDLITLTAPPGSESAIQVRMFPATVYGFATTHFDAAIARD